MTTPEEDALDQLTAAVISKDLARVDDALSQLQTLDTSRSYIARSNDLALAAMFGPDEVVARLLVHGFDANRASTAFGLPLSAAALKEQNAVVRRLLAAGANPEHIDFRGKTALDIALDAGFQETTALLVLAGAKVAVQQLDPALLLVVQTPHTDAARQLLALGALPDVRLKLDALDSDDAWKAGFTPLMLAAQSGRDAMVSLLMDAGADPMASADNGRTLLMCVAAQALAERVDQFLGMGHDPLATQFDGWTVLMSAAAGGDAGITKQLLDLGCPVNARDETGWTALMSALSWGHPAVVERLLAHGADPHATDDQGFTVLMAAVESESAALVAQILATTPDLTRQCDGETALDMAEAAEQTEIAELLRAAGAPSAKAKARALGARQRQAAMESLERCLPGFDPRSWPDLAVDSDALSWLYDGLRPQNLIDYFEWKAYWGEWPSVAPLTSLGLADTDADGLLAIVEADPPNYPSQVPWFSYLNHLLKAHGLCLVTVAQENIYIMCVRDDPAALEHLNNCLSAMRLHLRVHSPLDLDACRLALQQQESPDD